MFTMKLRLAALGCAAAFAATPALADDLVIYTSQPSDQMNEVLALFNKQHPEIKVDLFRSGTTEVLNKLQAEIAAGNPQADILLIADSVAMQQLKNQGILQPYADADISLLPDGQYDPEKYYFGTKLITTGIVYNTASGVPAPKSWKDLLSAAAKNQVIMPSPLYSGAAVIHVGTLVQQDGFGWDYFKALAENGATVGKGNGSVSDAVARGEKAYGVLIDYMAFGQKKAGSPVDFVFPVEGVTAINQPVGILKGSKHLDAAKRFVDFQLSRAAAEQSVQQNYFPILKGVAAPEGYPDPAQVKIMKLDADALIHETDDLKHHFADLFGG